MPTAEEILRAYAVAARLVELYGEEFLPFFEDMEQEVESLRARQNAVVRAKAVSSGLRASGYIPGHISGYIDAATDVSEST